MSASEVAKYPRLLGQLAKFTLAREMSFRSNFLVKISVEVIWLGIIVAFYATVFGKTQTIAGWDQTSYLFFVGCFFALNGMVETLFLENCNEFAELVRTGDLDFLLLKPVDEQFIVTCRKVDWATAPNVVMGAIVMVVALAKMGWAFDVVRILAFLVTFVSGTIIAYSFMLMLTSISVWMIRNQGLMEMWWLFSSLARYPRQIFLKTRVEPLGMVFTFVLPILLVSNIPADVMVRTLEPGMVAFTVFAAVFSFVVSRKIFQRALRSYRSASS